MAYLLTGALGFLLGYLTELGAARRLLPLRLSLWAVCLGLIGHSLVMVAVQSPRFRLHESAVLAGWALLPIAALLLVYSLFIELPLARTYARVRSPIRVITIGGIPKPLPLRRAQGRRRGWQPSLDSTAGHVKPGVTWAWMSVVLAKNKGDAQATSTGRAWSEGW